MQAVSTIKNITPSTEPKIIANLLVGGSMGGLSEKILIERHLDTC